jgi:Nucleotidyl transferase AbiEii toxin, Type IV TA system
MLYQDTVAKPTLGLLESVMVDDVFSNFRLAGGTALSLQLGHRLSIDLDLFTNEPFEQNDLADHLRIVYGFEMDFIANNTIKGELNGVKLDFIAHRYPWILPDVHYDNIRLATIEDISAMKLNAISGNGTRLKDYIDVAWLSTKMSFNDMAKNFALKYGNNPVMALKSLSYYDDVNFNEPIKMMKGNAFDWIPIRERLSQMHLKPNKVFNKLELLPR